MDNLVLNFADIVGIEFISKQIFVSVYLIHFGKKVTFTFEEVRPFIRDIGVYFLKYIRNTLQGGNSNIPILRTTRELKKITRYLTIINGNSKPSSKQRELTFDIDRFDAMNVYFNPNRIFRIYNRFRNSAKYDAYVHKNANLVDKEPEEMDDEELKKLVAAEAKRKEKMSGQAIELILNKYKDE